MRDGPWKVLADAAFKHVELYNLKNDPAETSDLAARHPERAATMTQRLEQINRDMEAENVTWPPFDRAAHRKAKAKGKP